MMKFRYNKAQKTLNGLTGTVAGLILYGLAGSLEVDRLTGRAFLLSSILVLLISAFAWCLLSIVNMLITQYLIGQDKKRDLRQRNPIKIIRL